MTQSILSRVKDYLEPAQAFLVKYGRLVLDFAPVDITIRAVNRMMAREVMLFAGGASFFGLLALFPAALVGASAYGLLFSGEEASNQLAALQVTEVLPPSAYEFLNGQLAGLADTSARALTLQGVLALLVLWFASARGAKAIIAGLNQIARRGDLRNVIHFNLLAMAAVITGGALLVGANLLVITVPNIIRPALEFIGVNSFDFTLLFNEWTTAGGTMVIALFLLYRFVMQRAGETSVRASLLGAATATIIWLLISKGFSVYVSTVVNPSTYGQLGALIVFLLWIYWAAYAVFFGGALAIEMDRRTGRLVSVGD